jgi:hypothetical protein
MSELQDPAPGPSDERLLLLRSRPGIATGVGPTQQLINEVLSAGKVTNLRPYLPTLKPQRRLFQV